jgi:hypothetical protein
MNHAPAALGYVVLCLACMFLSACAGRTVGERMADMPHWMGGEPPGVPPRQGTSEYDAWIAARAEAAAKPKTEPPKTESKTEQSKTALPK